MKTGLKDSKTKSTRPTKTAISAERVETDLKVISTVSMLFIKPFYHFLMFPSMPHIDFLSTAFDKFSLGY